MAAHISQLPSRSKNVIRKFHWQGIRVPLTAVLTSMDAALVTQMKWNHIISIDRAHISAKGAWATSHARGHSRVLWKIMLMGHGSRRRVNWPRTLKKLLLQLLIAISAGRRTEINIIFMYHGHREGRKAALLCADGHYAKIYQTWWLLLSSWLNVLNRGRSSEQ